MDIAFSGEIGPLLTARLMERPYFEKLNLLDVSSGRVTKCHLFCCDEIPRFPFTVLKTDVCILPNSISVLPPFVDAKIAVSCGMQAHDTVSFSSIGESHAMLCLTRAVPCRAKFIEPFEARVPLFRKYSIYRNLAVSFCLIYLDICYGKERNKTSEAIPDKRSAKCAVAHLP